MPARQRCAKIASSFSIVAMMVRLILNQKKRKLIFLTDLIEESSQEDNRSGDLIELKEIESK